MIGSGGTDNDFAIASPSLSASLDLQGASRRLIVVTRYPASFNVRFDFHSCNSFLRRYKVDCGERRRLPIQAKMKCEIAGRGRLFFARIRPSSRFWASPFARREPTRRLCVSPSFLTKTSP
jgi:hypothetical protein